MSRRDDEVSWADCLDVLEEHMIDQLYNNSSEESGIERYAKNDL